MQLNALNLNPAVEWPQKNAESAKREGWKKRPPHPSGEPLLWFKGLSLCVLCVLLRLNYSF